MSNFTEEDIRLLEKTKSIKERMIDNLFAVGKELPTKPRDIDSYTNLLESAERSVFDRVKISIDEASNKINEGTKELLTDLLISLHKGEIPTPTENLDRIDTIPTYAPQGIEVNKGVLIPKIDNVTLSDVVDE